MKSTELMRAQPPPPPPPESEARADAKG